MLKILKFCSPYFWKISCPPLFKVQYLKNYSREIKNFVSDLKLINNREKIIGPISLLCSTGVVQFHLKNRLFGHSALYRLFF